MIRGFLALSANAFVDFHRPTDGEIGINRRWQIGSFRGGEFAEKQLIRARRFLSWFNRLLTGIIEK